MRETLDLPKCTDSKTKKKISKEEKEEEKGEKMSVQFFLHFSFVFMGEGGKSWREGRGREQFDRLSPKLE